jgi:hypothetical protein
MLRAAVLRPAARRCAQRHQQCHHRQRRRLGTDAAAGGEVAALLRSGEEQLGALPDAAEASAQCTEQRFRAAVGHQQRVVDIFSAVPDPTLQLVTARQLAVLHGLLGDYASEAKQRHAVVVAAAALPSPAAVAAATAAAQYELSVSSLRAGDLATATTAAAAAADAACGDTAEAVCEGWASTVAAAALGRDTDSSAAAAGLEATIARAPASVSAELSLQLGNALRHAGGGGGDSAAAAFEAAIASASADGAALPAGLSGVVARVKLGEADMVHVESEAKKQIRGTRSASQEDVATKEQLDAVLDRKIKTQNITKPPPPFLLAAERAFLFFSSVSFCGCFL